MTTKRELQEQIDHLCRIDDINRQWHSDFHTRLETLEQKVTNLSYEKFLRGRQIKSDEIMEELERTTPTIPVWLSWAFGGLASLTLLLGFGFLSYMFLAGIFGWGLK